MSIETNLSNIFNILKEDNIKIVTDENQIKYRNLSLENIGNMVDIERNKKSNDRSTYIELLNAFGLKITRDVLSNIPIDRDDLIIKLIKTILNNDKDIQVYLTDKIYNKTILSKRIKELKIMLNDSSDNDSIKDKTYSGELSKLICINGEFKQMLSEEDSFINSIGSSLIFSNDVKTSINEKYEKLIVLFKKILKGDSENILSIIKDLNSSLVPSNFLKTDLKVESLSKSNIVSYINRTKIPGAVTFIYQYPDNELDNINEIVKAFNDSTILAAKSSVDDDIINEINYFDKKELGIILLSLEKLLEVNDEIINAVKQIKNTNIKIRENIVKFIYDYLKGSADDKEEKWEEMFIRTRVIVSVINFLNNVYTNTLLRTGNVNSRFIYNVCSFIEINIKEINS